MPGFRVNTADGMIGDPRSPITTDLKPFLSYTWFVPELFGEQIGENDATIYLKECILPSFSVRPANIQGASLNYKYAESVTWGDMRLVWYDVSNGGQKLITKLKEWRSSVWTAEDGIKLADAGGNNNGYKKNSTIMTNTSDGSVQNIYKLYGSWIVDLKFGSLTMERSEHKFVEAVIACDWCDESYG